LLVEVGSEQPTTAVFEHRIHADQVAPLKMIEDCLVAHGDECLVRALPAFHVGLLAHAAHPLVRADWSIAMTAGSWVLPVPRVDVVTAAEQPPEQCDLLGGRDRAVTGSIDGVPLPGEPSSARRRNRE
jgi:hypothetical protein